MKKEISILVLLVILVVLAFIVEKGEPGTLTDREVELSPFEVLVRNTSLDTTLSPGLYVIHDREFSLNYSGELSPGALEPLAEYGDNAEFIEYVTSQAGVTEVIPIDFSLPPGEDFSIFIEVDPRTRPLLSGIQMLTNSNDGVAVIDSAQLFSDSGQPFLGPVSAVNFDNGTEENNEPGSGFEFGQPDPERGEDNIENGEPTEPQRPFTIHPQMSALSLEISIIPGRVLEE